MTNLSELNALFPQIQNYQNLANRHGVFDIFQDNGGKVLQVCLTLDLKIIVGRSGNDAVDILGNEYELKSLNILNKQKIFTTHHHLNEKVLKKYRNVNWIFSTFENIILKEIYGISSTKLEPYFKEWENKLSDENLTHLNNPKIPLKFIKDNGNLLYSK